MNKTYIIHFDDKNQLDSDFSEDVIVCESLCSFLDFTEKSKSTDDKVLIN